MKTRSAQSLPRARELTEVFHEGSDICLKCVIKELKNDKPHYDTESPLGSAFDLYFTLSGTKLDDWTAAVSERAGNQVLFIELLELLNVAFRWNAIVTTLDYDYGDEFTLTSLAIREKLGRIHKIIKGDTLMMPTPLEILRAS